MLSALTRLFNPGRPNTNKAPRFADLLLPEDATATLDDLKTRFSIDIAVPGEPFFVWQEHGQYLTGVEGAPATSDQASWYIPLFAEEFGLYPPRLVHQTLARVVLCGDLFRSQKLNPGAVRYADYPMDSEQLTFEHRRQAGIPDGRNGLLYLSITCGRDDKDYVRKTIHHEFYHCVQRRQFSGRGDPEWAELNCAGFCVRPRRPEGKRRFGPDFLGHAGRRLGQRLPQSILNECAEEDQAEIFAHLLTEPARVAFRLPADDILCSKVERLKATLEEFCADVNTEFWQEMEESRPPFGL